VPDVNKILKDGAYVALGFGVLGFQKAQVRRRQATRMVDELVKRARTMGGLA
jgi:hypothetical protein